MKINHKLLFVLSMCLFVLSCEKKTQQRNDIEILRNNNNTNKYPAVQMDSTQAINSITQQKVQELMDLSILYLEGNRKTKIDSAIYKQMQDYFIASDSTTFKNLFSEIEGYKAKTAKINDLKVYKEVQKKDTLDFAQFGVTYYNTHHKPIAQVERKAQYTLAIPNKDSKEFRFYFLKFYLDKDSLSSNDSISSGVTK